MKKIYLLVLLVIGSLSLYGQDGSDAFEIIERDILGALNINNDVVEKRQIIGAARSSKGVEELPLTVYIITREDIVNNGYLTLCDVLKAVPGFRVSQPQSGELGEAFMQRGMVGNIYTKILLNGVDIKPTGMYGMPLGANLPIRQASRIEIIYGPASASYGNDACAGVINIVTRTPDDGYFTSADLQVGTGGTRYINFHSASKLGHGRRVSQLSIYGNNLAINDLNVSRDNALYNRWNYFLQNGDTLPMQLADGQTYKITREMITPDMFEKYSDLFSGMSYYFINYKGDFYTPEINEMPQNSSQVGVEYKYGGISASYNLLHRMDFADFGQSSMTYSYYDPKNLMGEYIHRGVVSADYKLGTLHSNTVFNYISYRMDKNSSRGVNWSTAPQYTYGASDDVSLEENITWNPIENFFINTGASYRYSGVLPQTLEADDKFDFDSYKPFASSVDYKNEVFGSFGIYPYTFWQAGAYLLTDFDWKRLSITGGVRYDYNSQWGNSVNPRIAAILKFTDHLTLRASHAYAYKTPSPSQIYYCVGVAMDTQLGKVIALHHVPTDPDELSPERISSTEVGLRFYLNQKSYFEVVGYTNRIKDPLVRGWTKLEDLGFVAVEQYGQKFFMPGSNGDMYPQAAYVGVTDFFSTTKGRDWTRAFKNETNAKTKLYGMQLIGVLKDIEEHTHLGFDASVNLTMGTELLSNNNATAEEFLEVDYIRGTPKQFIQVAAEMDLGKIFHLRIDNVYCSKFARSYYQATDNPYFWSPQYYVMDVALTAKVNKHLSAILKVTNTTNTLYGGIDVKSMDVDLPYNPQTLRTIRFGLTYDF